MTSAFVAEVVNTSIAYKESTDRDGNILPRGSIQFRVKNTTNAFTLIDYAAPIDSNNIEVPLAGEHVMISVATADISSPTSKVSRYYYSKTINIQDSVNANVLPFVNAFIAAKSKSQTYNTIGIRNNSNPITDKTVKDLLLTHELNNTVGFLQPFEGDKLLQSRFGSAIRFSSTVTGNTSIYGNTPQWEGRTNGDPIVAITSGLRSSSNYYTIEDINEDKSSIYLLSNQRLRINTRPLNSNIKPIDNYTGAQVIINSDRLVFNSKSDSIILSSAKTVGVSTRTWKADLTEIFDILEELVQQISDLTTGKSQFQTPMGGPTLTATNAPQLQRLLTRIKAMKQ